MLGEEPVLTPEAGGLNIALADANRAADVLIAFREVKLGISTASVRQPTLDEVFLALTGTTAPTTSQRRCADGDLGARQAVRLARSRVRPSRETI